HLIGFITHETASSDKHAERIDGGQAIASRQSDNLITMRKGCDVRWKKQTPVWGVGKRPDDALDVSCGIDRARNQFDGERRSHLLCCSQKIIIDWDFGVCDESDALQLWRDLLEHSQPLSNDAFLVEQQTGKIATRARQVRHKS